MKPNPACITAVVHQIVQIGGVYDVASGGACAADNSPTPVYLPYRIVNDILGIV